MKMSHLMIIDDSYAMRQFMAQYLRRNYLVTDCATPQEALELLSTGTLPDVVLTDLDMPEMNGLNFMKCVHYIHPTMPVVIISGMKESAERLRCLEAGAVDFISKPFHPKELELRVRKVLEVVEMQKNKGKNDDNNGPKIPFNLTFN